MCGIPLPVTWGLQPQHHHVNVLHSSCHCLQGSNYGRQSATWGLQPQHHHVNVLRSSCHWLQGPNYGSPREQAPPRQHHQAWGGHTAMLPSQLLVTNPLTHHHRASCQSSSRCCLVSEQATSHTATRVRSYLWAWPIKNGPLQAPGFNPHWPSGKSLMTTHTCAHSFLHN